MKQYPKIERGKIWYFSEILNQAEVETAQQAVTLAELRALTIGLP